ncbi:MAG: hypothetical protein ACOYM9_07015 [Bradymonadia bacterium]|jgi:hypothetical protein
MKFSFPDRLAVASCLVALLLGCGGPREGPRTPIPNRVVHVTGGTYAGVCVRPGRLRLRMPYAEEVWRLDPTPAPLGPSRAGPSAPCQGAEVPLELGGRMQVGPLTLVLAPTRFSVLETATGIEVAGRSLSGPIYDVAAVDPWLYVASEGGLYRARLDEPLRRVGGVGLALEPLRQVFRDGDALWLRGKDDLGQPVAIRAAGAVPLAEPARLPEVDRRVRAPVQGGRLEAVIGGEGLRHLDADGLLGRIVPLPAVEALLPLDGGRRVVTVAGRVLTFWRVAGLSLERELEVPLPGITRRVLEVGDALIVAGDYGLLILRR